MTELVHNDFHQNHALFHLFDHLAVADIEMSSEVQEATNGSPTTSSINGTAPNAEENQPLTNGLLSSH
jgi:hypothetical protein